MKKRAIAFIALFLCTALFFCLSACNNAENNARDNEMDEIYIGTPATELSRSEQNFYANYIADYTEFIKASVCKNIQKNHPHINWETTVIVDRFYIYDFSQVNLETLTENEKTVFGYIQNEVLTDCRMVVCCEGFWNYYSPNHLFPLSRIILEMFASDDAFTPMLLEAVFGALYTFDLPKETRILDFGSEYAFRYQPTYEEAASFIPQYKTVTPVTAE